MPIGPDVDRQAIGNKVNRGRRVQVLPNLPDDPGNLSKSECGAGEADCGPARRLFAGDVGAVHGRNDNLANAPGCWRVQACIRYGLALR
jgi:hypothetical protein